MHRLRKQDLKFHKPQLLALHAYINDLLILIDDKIKMSYNQGNDNVVVPLSGTFDVPKMSSVDARKKIHSTIIQDLISDERGFDVQYSQTKNGRFMILIKWGTLGDEHEKKTESEVLQFYAAPIDEQKEYSNRPLGKKYRGVKSLRN